MRKSTMSSCEVIRNLYFFFVFGKTVTIVNKSENYVYESQSFLKKEK